MNLRMLSKMTRPSPTAPTIVAKLSSCSTMSAGVLGDVGARDAHRHADVGLLERRRVVDAVAGHRHDVAVALQRVDDPQLVLRRHARVDRRPPRRLGHAVIVERRQLGAGHGARRPSAEAEVAGDRRGGERVVAGDHHDPYARPSRQVATASRTSGRAGSIMPSSPSSVSPDSSSGPPGRGRVRPEPHRDAEHAHALAGEPLARRQRARAPAGVERDRRAADVDRVAASAAGRRARPS